MALNFNGRRGGGYQQAPAPSQSYGAVISQMTQSLNEARTKNIDKEITDYFTNESFSEGGLNVNSEGLSFNSDFILPNYKEAWDTYKGINSRNGKTAGMAEYGQFKQLYSDMSGMYAGKLKADIQKHLGAGYTERDVRHALNDNGLFSANLSTLIADPLKGDQYAGAFGQWGPRKSLLEKAGSNPGITGLGLGAAGVGAIGATNYLQATSPEIIQKAKDTAKSGLKGAQSRRDIRTDVTKSKANKYYTDTVEYLKKNGIARTSPEAKILFEKARRQGQAVMNFEPKKSNQKFKADKLALGSKYKTESTRSRASELLKKAGKLGTAGKVVSYMAAPMLAESAVANITDSDTAGELAGSGTAAAMSGVETLSGIKALVKKHGSSKVIKKVASKMGSKAAVGILAKLGLGATGTFTMGATTAMAAGFLASDLYNIYNILQDMD